MVPHSLAAGCGVTGGTIALVVLAHGVAVVAAGCRDTGALRTLGVLPMAAVAVIEEAAKLIGPCGTISAARGAARVRRGYGATSS